MTHTRDIMLLNSEFIPVTAICTSCFVGHLGFTQNLLNLSLSNVHIWFSQPQKHINRGIIWLDG